MRQHEFETGKGVVRDSTGEIQYRTDLDPGTWPVPDGHTVEEFDTFEEVLALDWPPSLSLSLSSESITADGSDTVDVTVTVNAERSADWGEATLAVEGDAYPVDVSTGSAAETITTTSTQTGISIEARHPDLGSATTTIAVNQT